MTILLRLNLIICMLVMSCFWIPLQIRHLLPVEHVKGRSVCRILSISIAAGGLIAFLACLGRNSYYDSMVKEAPVEVADSRYLPFSEGNALHTLEESSHLHLLHDLPVIEGSSTMLPYYASMIEMIYPESILDIEGSECPFQYTQETDLYYKLITGQVDMIFTESDPSTKANTELKKRDLKLVKTQIGQVAFVFFVNNSNEIDSLTVNQIRSIYSGGITNWSSLGGSDTEILVFQSDEDSSIRNSLRELMGRLNLKESIPTYEISGEEGIAETELSYMNAPGAIGCTYSCYLHGIDVDKGLKLLKVEGVSPSTDEDGWESYCLMKPVYCVTVESRETTNKKLIRDWVLSDQGQRLLMNTGFYPLAH